MGATGLPPAAVRGPAQALRRAFAGPFGHVRNAFAPRVVGTTCPKQCHIFRTQTSAQRRSRARGGGRGGKHSLNVFPRSTRARPLCRARGAQSPCGGAEHRPGDRWLTRSGSERAAPRLVPPLERSLACRQSRKGKNRAGLSGGRCWRVWSERRAGACSPRRRRGGKPFLSYPSGPGVSDRAPSTGPIPVRSARAARNQGPKKRAFVASSNALF